MHNLENNSPKPVQAKLALPLQDWLAGAVALVIQPADEVAVGPGGFIPQERKRPVASPVSSIRLVQELASTTTHVLQEIDLQRYEAHSHWGLNE